MSTLLFIIAISIILDGLYGIYLIGKQRPVVTAGYAIANILFCAFFAVVLIIAALHY